MGCLPVATKGYEPLVHMCIVIVIVSGGDITETNTLVATLIVSVSIMSSQLTMIVLLPVSVG
jgi:hypothetical protein